MDDNTEVPTKEISDALAMVSVIERALANPNVDVEKLERMLVMQEKILDRQAQVSFARDMREVQSKMPAIVKNSNNEQTNSEYATLEAVCEGANPIITENGFSLSFGTADSPKEGHYRVTGEVTHIEGHSRSYFADVPIDATGIMGKVNKTNTHAFGSTMSYGRRYLTLMIFNIAVKDDDDGQGTGNVKRRKKSTDPDWKGPLKKTALSNAAKEVVQNMLACDDLDSLTAYWETPDVKAIKKQLADAEALVDKLLAERSPNGHHMAGHPVLGTVNKPKNRWAVQINIAGERFVKHGFLCMDDAEDWRRQVSDAIGFDAAYARMKEDKAAMAERMREIMARGVEAVAV